MAKERATVRWKVVTGNKVCYITFSPGSPTFSSVIPSEAEGSAVSVHPKQRPRLMSRRIRFTTQARRRLMNVVNHNRVALELHFVIIPARAIHVTATVCIRMMSQLHPLGRPHQGSLGLHQLGLCIGHSLVGVCQRFYLGGSMLLRPYRSRGCIGCRGCGQTRILRLHEGK